MAALVSSAQSSEVPTGMLFVPGGIFTMGSDRFYPEEAPTRKVRVDPFFIDETPVTGLQSSVRLLFQDARLLPWQRVISNVGIARAFGWREAAQAALADVGLADRANDWPAVLSGGQRQRVALARALVNHPGVLLLDEPFGALDALTRQEMHQLVTQIWQSHGFTTVLITHDVREAVTLADRVLVLRGGRIALDLEIPDARPRLTGNAKLAALEAEILREV